MVENKLSFEEFEAILDSSYDGIHITDGVGVTLFYNEACERIEGNKKEDMVGKQMSELLAAGIYKESITLKVLKTKERMTMLQESNGRTFMCSATPIFHNGVITRVVTNSRDITELNELKRELEKTKQMNEQYHSELEQWRLEQMNNDIVVRDSAMKKVMDVVFHVAAVDSTVLIQGESGVGKGVISHLIHQQSNRKNKPFMKIDCGALTESLLESELFGYEKGAFTSAHKDGKIGLIEMANGGTLFLDEIAELSLALQIKLLRVVQDREFIRVGGTKTIPVDIRIITATHKNLEQMVAEKMFREDLYYRLNVVPIHIPPLRERREDIYPLIVKNVNKFNKRYQFQKKIAPDALDAFIQFDWPGNVRELENMMERLVVTTVGETISMQHLPLKMRSSPSTTNSYEWQNGQTLAEAVAAAEKQFIQQALQESTTILEIADRLQVDQSTVRRKLKKHGLTL